MLFATRGGPAASTLVREVASRGRPALLAAVAEVWGAGDLTLQRDVERRLLAGLAGTVEQIHGSATLRLRTAFQRVDRWLVDVVQPELGQPAGAIVAGVTAALAEDDAVVVAQTGPGFAWLPLGEGEYLREPASSPWLTTAVQTAGPTAWAWPALGQGQPPSIAWSSPPLGPGDGVLILTTAGAGLGASAVAALFAAPDTDLLRLASAYFAPEAAFVRLVLPGEAREALSQPLIEYGVAASTATRVQPRPDAAAAPALAASPRFGAAASPAAVPKPTIAHPPFSVAPGREAPPSQTTEEPRSPGFPLPTDRLKGIAGYLTRLLVAILPVRSDDDDGGYRLLAARFAAALALVFPILVLVLTWLAAAGTVR